MTALIGRQAAELARHPRTLEFLKFSAVGCSGIVMNLGTYYLLTRGVHLSIEIASPVAIELALLWNFLLNDCWTFCARRIQQSLATRLIRFHAASLVAGLANYLILLLLTRSVGLWDIYAYLCGIAVGAVLKFCVDSGWTWREQAAA